MSSPPRPTAAIIVIGNEILSGQTLDTNSHCLCKYLFRVGVAVQRVCVVPDSVADIAEEVAQCSLRYTIVFTSGGVGPTHDDVTYEGVSKAFNEELCFNDEFFRLFESIGLSSCYRSDYARKLTIVPKSSVIVKVPWKGEESTGIFPLVSYKNVYMLPGIPEYFKVCVKGLEEQLIRLQGLRTLEETCLFLNCSEYDVADILRKVADHFKGRNNAQFGSYPKLYDEYYKVKVTIQADSKESLDIAEAYLRSMLPMNCVTYPFAMSSGEPACALYALASNSHSPVAKLVADAIEALETCFNRYSPSENLAIAFNGGKDCTALVHLTTCVLQQWCRKHGSEPKKLCTIYIRSTDTFPELEEFIDQCVTRYNLDLHCYSGSQADAMWQVWSTLPKVRAVLMGTRQTDPNSEKLSLFANTDEGWAPHVRLHLIGEQGQHKAQSIPEGSH